MKLCNNCIHLKKQKKTHTYICLNSRSKLFKVPFPHGKTRAACRFYEIKGGVPKRTSKQTPPKGLKFIENYRNDYKGSDFWIIGCDPNLDFYPDDFFNNKFSIAIGASCIGFPESTFLFPKDRRIVDAIKYARPDLLKRSIIILQYRGSPKGILWSDLGLDPIYMKSKTGKHAAQFTREDWELMVEQLLGEGPFEFLTVGTGTNYAIEAAAVLGAKKIILVGCSGKTTKHQWYAHKRGMWAFCQERFSVEWGKLVYVVPGGEIDEYPASFQMGDRISRQYSDMRWLTEILDKHGVETVRHRYDEDKDDFVFEEMKGD